MTALRHIVPLAAMLALAGCQRAHTASPLPQIDWRTSPLDLDLRGMNGKDYRFHCPAGKPAPWSVTGTGKYTDASSICAAAAHAGAIDSQRGGVVMIRILPGQDRYRGSTRNFIRSADYAHAWSGSFAVLPVDDFDAGRKRARGSRMAE
jgi:LCCL domain-containing protein